MKPEECEYRGSKVKLHYLKAGKGKPIIFLHGVILHAHTYDRLILKLAEQYLVIAPDMPGFGQSDVPGSVWSFIDYGKYFSQFIDSLNINDVTVIGHSFGGGVAVNIALMNRKVTKLILIDAVGTPMQFSFQKFLKLALIKTTFEVLHTDKKVAIRLVYDVVVHFCLRHLFQLFHIYKIIVKSMYSRYPIYEVKIPTLILWGRKDEILPTSYGTYLKRVIKNSHIMTIDGNHDWCLLDNQKFNSLVTSFIDN